MTDKHKDERGRLSDSRDQQLVDGKEPLDPSVDYIPLHLSKRVLFWEEILSFGFLVYAGLAFLKVFKVLQTSHVSMAVGPAIFGVTGLIGTYALFRLSKRKRVLRAREKRGRYRLGVFLLEDRVLINIPRLLRSVPYRQIHRVSLESTFQGHEPDALCLGYRPDETSDSRTIRISETFACSHQELESRIKARLTP